MCTQNLAFVRMYPFRMKSTERFINEIPAVLFKRFRAVRFLLCFCHFVCFVSYAY